MPIYRYQCKECNHAEELIQSYEEGEAFQQALATSDDHAGVRCPKCDTPNWRRVIGGTQFKLAGRGWYKDDYR